MGLALLFTFLLACFGGNQAPKQQDTGEPIRDDTDYDRIRRNDTDRKEVLTRSKTRYTGRACEDEDRDHDCKDSCKDIYTRRADKKDCEELPVDQVAALEELHDLLKRPSERDLGEVDFEDFDVYLNISIQPLDKLIRKYSKTRAKAFMFWLIENEDVAQVFEKEDDEYSALKSLLDEISSADCDADAEMYKCFTAKVDGGDKLMELAIDTGNEDIMEWFMDFINEEHSGCESDSNESQKKACLTNYCKIGAGIDDEYREGWLDFEHFEDYIEDVISEGVNSNAEVTSGVISTDTNDGADVATSKKWCRGSFTEEQQHESCMGDTNKDRQIDEVDDLGEDWTDVGANKGICGGLL